MNSKDFLAKFSFQDILAYFLPGTATTLGVYVLFSELNLFELPSLEADIFTGILFFLVSFIVGITLSGVSRPIVNFFYWLKKKERPENLIPMEPKYKLKEALSEKLNIEFTEDWNEEYYLFCRIMVKELLPSSFSYSYRQEGLRLMRTYMLFPVLLWTTIGLIHGINDFRDLKWNGVVLMVLSLLLGGLLLLNIWNRMHKNKERAIKNVLVSFICLDKILEEKRKEG